MFMLTIAVLFAQTHPAVAVAALLFLIGSIFYNNTGPAITTLCEIGTVTNLPKYCAMGTNTALLTAASTALGTEVETRATGTQSRVQTTNPNDTMQCVGTQTATAPRVIVEAGLFDATSTGNVYMSADSATVGPFTLATGNSIQWTWQLKHVSG